MQAPRPDGDDTLVGDLAGPTARALADPTARDAPQPAVASAEGNSENTATESRAKEIVLTRLAARARSRYELASWLEDKEIPDRVIGRVLDRFEEVGLVDDRAFAIAWVESRQRMKGLARRSLVRELTDKGVAPHIIETAVAHIDAEAEHASAHALVEKKLRTMADLPSRVQTRRLLAHLARKGYPASTAYDVVREHVTTSC